MRCIALTSLVLGGCLWNPSVEVDRDSVDVPRGTSAEVIVSIDGVPVDDLAEVLWSVDDPSLASATAHGNRLRIGGNLEGSTVVHVSSHGQTLDIATHVGPPALLKLWIEPTPVVAKVGDSVQVKGVAFDSIGRVVDVSHVSAWTVTDTSLASLELAGMQLRAVNEGETELHASNGTVATMVPITILQ
jgi:hypothetical protein